MENKCFLRQGDICEKSRTREETDNPKWYSTIKYKDLSFHLPLKTNNLNATVCTLKYIMY